MPKKALHMAARETYDNVRVYKCLILWWSPSNVDRDILWCNSKSRQRIEWIEFIFFCSNASYTFNSSWCNGISAENRTNDILLLHSMHGIHYHVCRKYPHHKTIRWIFPNQTHMNMCWGFCCCAPFQHRTLTHPCLTLLSFEWILF